MLIDSGASARHSGRIRLGVHFFYGRIDTVAALLAAGWEIFTTYEDQLLSFTDCTSFALMRQRQLLEAFTFDTDFHRAGFVVRPTRTT